MALSEARTVTFQGPHIVTFPNGDVRTTEMTATYYDDWQDTPFGRINFGFAVFGPMRWVDAPCAALGEGQ